VLLRGAYCNFEERITRGKNRPTNYSFLDKKQERKGASKGLYQQGALQKNDSLLRGINQGSVEEKKYMSQTCSVESLGGRPRKKLGVVTDTQSREEGPTLKGVHAGAISPT